MVGVLFAFLFEALLCYTVGLPNSSADSLLTCSHLLMVINSAILFAYISRRYKEYDRSVVYALFGSLVLKIALLLWDYYGTSIFVLPNSHLDSESFHRGAVAFAKGQTPDVENYSYIVGYIYKAFGVQRLTAQYSNIILSFLGIDLLEKSLSELEIDDNAKRLTLIFAALLPNYLIMSAILIRECIISVILCTALYFFSRWWRQGRLIYLVLAGVTPLVACFFHSGSIAMSIGVAICAVFARRNEKDERYLRISVFSVLMSAVFAVGFYYLFNRLSESLLRRFHALDIVFIEGYATGHHFYEGTTGTSSAYSAGIAGISGWRGILINSPVRLLYFLWSPMPWNIRGIGDIIAFFGSSLFYGGTAFVGLFQIIARRDTLNKKALLVAMVVLALSGALIFAWGVDSAGSALRHREKFYFIYLLLFAVIKDRSQFAEETEARVTGYIK